MDLGLQGRKAAVTGGTRGIGRAIIDILAEEGCAVATCGRAPERVAAVTRDMEARGTKVHAEVVQGRDGEQMRG